MGYSKSRYTEIMELNQAGYYLDEIVRVTGFPQDEVESVLDGELYPDFPEEVAEEENDGQPDEYTEWQDYMGGDDWDHGQYGDI